MKRQRPALRLAIRIKQVQLIATGQRRLAQLLNRALRDRDTLDEAIIRATSGLAIGDGSLLDWFLENWEQILEIILTIIGLFSSKTERAEILAEHEFDSTEKVEAAWALADVAA